MSEHDTGTPLDAAIDRAVRHMMHVDPPPGLRRRVLSRLDTPAATPAWWPRLAMAGAGLAAILLAVVLLRPGPDAEPPIIETAAQPVDQPAVVAPPAIAEAARPAPDSRPRDDRPRVEALPPPPRMDTVFGASPDGRVAAASASIEPPAPPIAEAAAELPGLPPIDIPAIDVPPIEIRPLMLMPLTPLPINK